MLAWKNYGNGHVIFDASSGFSPSETVVSREDPQVFWSNSFPTLMGWNGVNTYGVRVDSSRVADYARSTDENLQSITDKGNITNHSIFLKSQQTANPNISGADLAWNQINFTNPSGFSTYARLEAYYANGEFLDRAGLKLYTGGHDGLQPRLTIDSQGNVGIGTTTPAQKLSVNGNISANAIFTSQSSDFANYGNTSTSFFEATLELINNTIAPRLSFHWAGVVASQIGIGSDGAIEILNNPGTGYESLKAFNIRSTNHLIADSAVYASNWFRSYGNNGWFNETHLGGIYMEDSTWVRVYGGKKFRAENDIFSATKIEAPTLKATDKLLIPTAPPSSLASGEAAMWIGNLSGITT
jgi:hypothetical protein